MPSNLSCLFSRASVRLGEDRRPHIRQLLRGVSACAASLPVSVHSPRATRPQAAPLSPGPPGGAREADGPTGRRARLRSARRCANAGYSSCSGMLRCTRGGGGGVAPGSQGNVRRATEVTSDNTTQVRFDWCRHLGSRPSVDARVFRSKGTAVVVETVGLTYREFEGVFWEQMRRVTNCSNLVNYSKSPAAGKPELIKIDSSRF